jgi:hypothetical protein
MYADVWCRFQRRVNEAMKSFLFDGGKQTQMRSETSDLMDSVLRVCSAFRETILSFFQSRMPVAVTQGVPPPLIPMLTRRTDAVKKNEKRNDYVA